MILSCLTVNSRLNVRLKIKKVNVICKFMCDNPVRQ